jgi:hypothetical protein
LQVANHLAGRQGPETHPAIAPDLHVAYFNVPSIGKDNLQPKTGDLSIERINDTQSLSIYGFLIVVKQALNGRKSRLGDKLPNDQVLIGSFHGDLAEHSLFGIEQIQSLFCA